MESGLVERRLQRCVKMVCEALGPEAGACRSECSLTAHSVGLCPSMRVCLSSSVAVRECSLTHRGCLSTRVLAHAPDAHAADVCA
eukprot:1718810-Rhodomonas_salina.2